MSEIKSFKTSIINDFNGFNDFNDFNGIHYDKTKNQIGSI